MSQNWEGTNPRWTDLFMWIQSMHRADTWCLGSDLITPCKQTPSSAQRTVKSGNKKLKTTIYTEANTSCFVKSRCGSHPLWGHSPTRHHLTGTVSSSEVRWINSNPTVHLICSSSCEMLISTDSNRFTIEQGLSTYSKIVAEEYTILTFNRNLCLYWANRKPPKRTTSKTKFSHNTLNKRVFIFHSDVSFVNKSDVWAETFVSCHTAYVPITL